MEALRDKVDEITLEYPLEIENTKPLEEVTPISIYPDYPDRHVMIGIELTEELQKAFVKFLKNNYNMFAWSQGDVPGIEHMHKLFTNPDHLLVRQKRRKFVVTPPKRREVESMC